MHKELGLHCPLEYVMRKQGLDKKIYSNLSPEEQQEVNPIIKECKEQGEGYRVAEKHVREELRFYCPLQKTMKKQKAEIEISNQSDFLNESNQALVATTLKRKARSKRQEVEEYDQEIREARAHIQRHQIMPYSNNTSNIGGYGLYQEKPQYAGPIF